jgi:hypothetical protein
MLEGNRFFPETGMPILKRALNRVRFEVWLPEPFAVPTVIEKSLTIGARLADGSTWIMGCIADIPSLLLG